MRVGQWYITCIVLNRDYDMFNNSFKASPSPSVRKLLFQNLDGSENHKYCRHLSQIATLGNRFLKCLFLNINYYFCL